MTANCDQIADAYWFLHTQPRTCFTHEIDVRAPYIGPFGYGTLLTLYIAIDSTVCGEMVEQSRCSTITESRTTTIST